MTEFKILHFGDKVAFSTGMEVKLGKQEPDSIEEGVMSQEDIDRFFDDPRLSRIERTEQEDGRVLFTVK